MEKTKDANSPEEIREVLWHIASALKKIELKLDQLEVTSHSLIGIESAMEHFADPFRAESQFSKLVELIEKQTQILAEQHYMRQHRN